MGFMMNMMVKFQVYLSQKRQPVECKGCNNIVVPRKEISVLNLIFYVIASGVIFFITKRKLVILLPIVLAVINSLLIKKRCPTCRDTTF